MEPLANAERRRVGGEAPNRHLRGSVFAEKAHIEVPIVGRAFRFAMARGGGPCLWQVKQAVPMDAGRLADEKFRTSLEAEILHFFGAERGYADFRNPDGMGPER